MVDGQGGYLTTLRLGIMPPAPGASPHQGTDINMNILKASPLSYSLMSVKLLTAR